MAHIYQNKKQLITRIKKIKGQLDAVERAIDKGEEKSEMDCFKVLQTLAAAKGAFGGLVQDLIEGHINDHIVHQDADKKTKIAADELIKIMRTFWK